MKALAAQQDKTHKVIVFCEFRQLQLLLQRVIATFFGLAASIVNGDTAAYPRIELKRQRLIDSFQVKPGFNVIILSPLALGFALIGFRYQFIESPGFLRRKATEGRVTVSSAANRPVGAVPK